MTEQLAIQTLLREELGKIQMHNPAFSARSFARKLGIAPSTINEVLNGKRSVSKKLAIKIMEKLAIDPKTQSTVLTKFDKKKMSPDTNKDMEFTTVAMDQYRSISEWYHFAILSLAETSDYRHDSNWIAKRLNIKITEAVQALDRLERLGMLQVKDNKLVTAPCNYHTTDHVNNLALRAAHAHNLELAKRSLEKDSIDQRDFCSMTMAIDPQKIPLAKQMIRDFRNKLCQFLEADEQTEVYKICFQLFPLTNLDHSQGESI